MTATDLRARVDDALEQFLDAATLPIDAVAGELHELTATARSFVLAGGKRLRPAFCYWGFRATGAADDECIIRAAAALELLQACALMHDDVIDASDTRRGSPAVHRRFAELHRTAGWSGDAARFGDAAAILLGDLVLVWADAMLTGSGFDAVALQRAQPAWDAMRAEVMCGQYLDVVEQARGGGSVERALRVARFKSAKYTVERPLHLGATLGGAAADLLDGFSAFGLPLGEAFQLRDDLLGVFGDPQHTGKPAGDDLREGKQTVLVAFAAEAADADQRHALRHGLGNPHLDETDIETLRTVIIATGAAQRVEQLIEDRTAQALGALDGLAMPHAVRAELRGLATAVTQRAR
ncbi:MAG TPA: polyprenyl synthetase family protein [Mycobacteriales bacterium]|nr:polyprenyl synthetase family protein [Mycobacteriales bacterium]